MATVIRFSRHGTKKKPYYRIVVQDQRAPRDGRFIEHIGSFDPVKGNDTITVLRERLEYWLGTGAQMSTSVKNTLKLKMREWRQPQAAAGVAETKKPASKEVPAPKNA